MFARISSPYIAFYAHRVPNCQRAISEGQSVCITTAKIVGYSLIDKSASLPVMSPSLMEDGDYSVEHPYCYQCDSEGLQGVLVHITHIVN